MTFTISFDKDQSATVQTESNAFFTNNMQQLADIVVKLLNNDYNTDADAALWTSANITKEYYATYSDLEIVQKIDILNHPEYNDQKDNNARSDAEEEFWNIMLNKAIEPKFNIRALSSEISQHGQTVIASINNETFCIFMQLPITPDSLRSINDYAYNSDLYMHVALADFAEDHLYSLFLDEDSEIDKTLARLSFAAGKQYHSYRDAEPSDFTDSDDENYLEEVQKIIDRHDVLAVTNEANEAEGFYRLGEASSYYNVRYYTQFDLNDYNL